MRVLVLLTLVALLCASAFGLTAPTTQEEAKTLRSFWQNCSQVLRGRLGALANTHAPTQYNGLVLSGKSEEGHEVSYCPCALNTDGTDSAPYMLRVTMAPGANSTHGEWTTYTFDKPVTPAQIVLFAMPVKKGDVANFYGQYYINHAGTDYDMANVTTQCGETDAVIVKTDRRTLSVTLQSIEACARFPYTNEAMPSGAIAALIVCLVCFALQFAVCGWYHKTYSHGSPYVQAE